jgi:hypothetical protein
MLVSIVERKKRQSARFKLYERSFRGRSSRSATYHADATDAMTRPLPPAKSPPALAAVRQRSRRPRSLRRRRRRQPHRAHHPPVATRAQRSRPFRFSALHLLHASGDAGGASVRAHVSVATASAAPMRVLLALGEAVLPTPAPHRPVPRLVVTSGAMTKKVDRRPSTACRTNAGSGTRGRFSYG